jgi:signal transduction histidine kinase
MVYEIALFCAVGVGLWIGRHSLGGARRSADLLALGVTLALWAGGELVIAFARDGSGILLGRRILYAGACFLPVAWLWLAAGAAGAGWIRRRPQALIAAALPAAFFYSCLYWETQGRFIVWSEFQPIVGVLFWCYAAYGWALILVGTYYLVAVATRFGAARPLQAGAILAGAMVPLLANVVHLTSGFAGHDLTPIFIGVGAVLLRFAVIDSGLAGILPRARRDVVEQLDSGVLVSNLQGLVVDANPAAGRLLGIDHLVGRCCQELLEGAPASPERVVEVREFAVEGLLGEVGRCVILTDRSEAQRIEQQLLQAQRLESLGILTAGIAHEVNNPLAFVRGNLGSLEEIAKAVSQDEVRAILPEDLGGIAGEAPDIVGEVRDGVDRIAQLVTSLKRFARPEGGGEPAPVSMVAVAERAASMAGMGLMSGMIRTHFESAPLVSASEGEMVQVVLNLLVNAVQATDGKTPIDLDVTREGDGVRLRVRDRGKGIPDDALPHIFDPFFTTKSPDEGTGLGLSLSFDLIRRHGGTLEGRNHADGGACFELWLPAAPDEPVRAHDSSATREHTLD